VKVDGKIDGTRGLYLNPGCRGEPGPQTDGTLAAVYDACIRYLSGHAAFLRYNKALERAG
jgi:hypothetical protein